MNSLSWMIYLAGVCGSASAFLTFLSVISALGSVGCLIGWAVTIGSPHIWSWDDKDAKLASHAKIHSTFGKAGPRLVLSMIAFGTAAAVLPSQSTIYAIAASEMGEKAITSQTGGKALKALDAWLDRQIAGEKKEDGE